MSIFENIKCWLFHRNYWVIIWRPTKEYQCDKCGRVFYKGKPEMGFEQERIESEAQNNDWRKKVL